MYLVGLTPTPLQRRGALKGNLFSIASKVLSFGEDLGEAFLHAPRCHTTQVLHVGGFYRFV